MGHEVKPERRLLTYVHANVLHASVFKQVLAAFIDQEFRVVEESRLVGNHPVGAGPGYLFVADGQENHIPVERYFLPFQHDHDHELGQAFVLHVLGSAPVQDAVDQGPAEWRDCPVRRVTGHHVHVVQQDEGALGSRGGVGKSRPQISAPGSVGKDTILDAFPVQNLLEEGGRFGLVAGRVCGVEAQILLQPGDSQVRVLVEPYGGDLARGE